MIVARWTITAKFGHKQEVINALKRWEQEIGSQIGWTQDMLTTMTGSVGALESTVVTEVRLASISELDESWNKLANVEGREQWSKSLEPHVVSGTNAWEIFRVV